MRIDLNHGPQSAADNTPANVSSRPAANNSASINSPVEDQAQLSGSHVQVQALAAQASQLPEVREGRVHALRQAVQSGHYQASPEKIAGALILHMIAGPAV